MKNIIDNRAAYHMPQGLFEYRLIVSPATEVYNMVMEEKQHFSRSYKMPVAGRTQPHIAISNFLAWENLEDTIIRGLHRLFKDQKCFSVTLNNYSGFPAHTVFLRIQDAVAINNLTAQISAIAPYIKEMECAPAKFDTYPHVTIAGKLPADVYEKAIRDYSTKEFNASFDVNELILLKRQNQHEACRTTAVFKLQPGEYIN